jgi:ribosomal protein S18 acetylase RimI-like enzyme
MHIRPFRMEDKPEVMLITMGCPKINIQVRATNADVLNFYRALGYQQDDVVSFGKRLIADV